MSICPTRAAHRSCCATMPAARSPIRASRAPIAASRSPRTTSPLRRVTDSAPTWPPKNSPNRRPPWQWSLRWCPAPEFQSARAGGVRGCQRESGDALGVHRRGACGLGRARRGQRSVVEEDERVGQRLEVSDPGGCGEFDEGLPDPVAVLLDGLRGGSPRRDFGGGINEGTAAEPRKGHIVSDRIEDRQDLLVRVVDTGLSLLDSLLPRLKAATKIGGDQFVLYAKKVIQRAFSHASLRDDGVDTGGMDTVAVEQLVRRGEQSFT